MAWSVWQMRRGFDAAPAVRKPLQAGGLSAVFEPSSGFLRHICYGQDEVLRGIYAAVRDHNWDTVEPTIEGLTITETEDQFRIAFSANCLRGDIDFVWNGVIDYRLGQALSYRFVGQARTAFRKNRIGFCVLHPASCAGLPCTVEHADGRRSEAMFPQDISPHQPVMGIRSISHQIAPGIRSTVRMTGEVFEMEDQRNWTDASFKTYCTPLGNPFPVGLNPGDRIEQEIVVELEQQPDHDPPSHRKRSKPHPVTVSVDWQSPGMPVPDVGLCAASHNQDLTEEEADRIRALGLSHLRVDLHLERADWPDLWKRYQRQAELLGNQLEVALFLSDSADEELARFVEVIRPDNVPVRRWMVFHEREKSTQDQWVKLARKRLSALGDQIPIGAGSNAYFTELNRQRPEAKSLDFACYSMNPQVHAFDDASLVETLEVQQTTLDSARTFVGGRPLVVSPVTLRPRFNPNATGPEPERRPGELPDQVDVRQMSLFGAVWTLGSLKYLTQGQVASVTYYETTGWRGVMETKQGPSLPSHFPSVPLGVYPLYHVLADVGEFRSQLAAARSLRSDAPLRAEGFALATPNRKRLIVANVSDHMQSLKLAGITGPWRVRVLDESTFAQSVQYADEFRQGGLELKPSRNVLELRLAPYATATLDQLEGVR